MKVFGKIRSFFSKQYIKHGYIFVPLRPRFVSKPAVLECGDGYAIVWATNVRASGYVAYTFENREQKVFDSKSGCIRGNDTIHVVKVKKEHLDGNSYRVHSQAVLYKFGYSALKGMTVSSEEYRFRGYAGQEEIKILCISDIHGHISKMKTAFAHLDEKPDMVALIGDITTTSIYKISLVREILKTAHLASGGEVPVVYTRGNHETRGNFAVNLIRYFPTDTNEFYFCFRYGPVSAVVIDSGEDKDDSHFEYSGLADFAAYRRQEQEWLKNLKPDKDERTKYRLAFSHSIDLDTVFGEDWEQHLKRIGTRLTVAGHSHRVNLNADGAYLKYTDGGSNDGTHTMSLITLKEGSISFKAWNSENEITFNEVIEVKA